jgi:hypothetical protein
VLSFGVNVAVSLSPGSGFWMNPSNMPKASFFSAENDHLSLEILAWLCRTPQIALDQPYPRRVSIRASKHCDGSAAMYN